MVAMMWSADDQADVAVIFPDEALRRTCTMSEQAFPSPRDLLGEWVNPLATNPLGSFLSADSVARPIASRRNKQG